NVVKLKSSVLFVAEPKYKEISDGEEDDDLYIEKEFETVKSKKNKNDRIKKVFVKKPKNISPKIWRKETDIVKKKAKNVEKNINKNKIEEQYKEFDEFNQNVIEIMYLYVAQIEKLHGGIEEVVKVLTDITKRLFIIENHLDKHN
ncbi:9806_t:CDS:2, partial [Dentiscutata erythropus]